MFLAARHLGDASEAEPRRGFYPVAALIFWVIAAGCSPSGIGRNQDAIPPIGAFAGVSLGDTTNDEIDRLLGPGQETLGGHPNSGRIWRVQGTDWTVQTDAWEWNERGMVVDEFNLATPASSVSAAHAASASYPVTRIPAHAFRFLGTISPGDSRETVLRKAARLPPQLITATNLVWKAAGHHAGGTVVFTEWTAALEFREDRLVEISLGARHEYRSQAQPKGQ